MTNIWERFKAHKYELWLDQVSRALVLDGELLDYLSRGVTGVTSNPAIFQKAFSSDKRYAFALAELKENQGLRGEAAYEALAIADIQMACDALLSVFEASAGESGWVSFELAPYLAGDCAATVTAARRVFAKINRKNAMIKLPATAAGVQAMRVLLEEDLMPLNMTLLFSSSQVEACFEQYQAALEARLSAGKSIAGAFAVASVFLSRWDTRLDPSLPRALAGKTALALARQIYAKQYLPRFEGENFAALREAGALPQKLVWASTGTKNPEYSPTLYVDSLLFPNTINTVPEATLQLFLKQKAVLPLSGALMFEADEMQLASVSALGVDLDAEGEVLQRDGLKLFEEAFATLLEMVA